MKRLRHRGPDGSGLRLFERSVLAHTRLSIQDLTEAASQPMSDEHGCVWVVFNGEIYNFRELRARLINRGHQFRSDSDTEVIPHLYEEHGLGLFEYLRGMFALAVWDEQRGRLILGRDRFGVKPLYWWSGGDGSVAFASEIKGILPFCNGTLQVDWQAIADYFAFFVVPEPATGLNGIQALEPGTWLSWQDGAVTQGRYHQWSVELNRTLGLREAEERTGVHLGRSVNSYLAADVPIGIILSGGIDSALVASTAAPALSSGLRAFHVSFDDDLFNEEPGARETAQTLGLTLSVLRVENGLARAETLGTLLDHFDQPFADSSLVAAASIFRAIGRELKVVLSGDGGDEAFCGYDTFRHLLWAQHVRRLGGSAALRALDQLPVFDWHPRIRRLVRRSAELAGGSETQMIERLLAWMSPGERKRMAPDLLASAEPAERLLVSQWRIAGSVSAAEAAFIRLREHTTRISLQCDYLKKVDMMSMAASVEVRVPFLDEELFAFSLTLQPHLLVDSRRGKKLLRQLVRDQIGNRIAARPKQGFCVPLDRWLGAQARKEIADQTWEAIRRGELPVVQAEVEPWLRSFIDGKDLATISRQGLFQRVLMLWALARWLARVKMGPQAW